MEIDKLKISIEDMIREEIDKDIEESIREYMSTRWSDWFTLEKFKVLRVHGVEVTQSIQYYRANEHLTDPSDRGPDNSLRLVAYKPAWVRVYVRRYHKPIANVTGTVDVERQVFGKLWNKVATLTAEPPGSVTAENVVTSYSTERGNISSTLNFIIPEEKMFGNLRLRITINSGNVSDTKTVEIDATLKQTLKLSGIMVGYNGPNATGTANINLAAPVLADLQNTSPWTLTTYPVSEATYRVVSTITQIQPLTDPPNCAGCCSTNWSNLLADLAVEKVADGNQPGQLYYGLLANGIPMGPVIGCASSVVGSGNNGDQVTMAHELGHQLGFGHSPCNVPGEAGYPAYEPYDPAGTSTASIGEYGLDINNGDVKSPANHKCYMSYCGPQWMSLNRYGRLVQHNDLNPEFVGTSYIWVREWRRYDPFWRFEPDPPPYKIRINPMDVISIIGVVSRNKVIIKSVTRVATHVKLDGKNRLPMTAELLDNKGNALSTASVYRLPHTATGCDCPSCHDQTEPDNFAIQAFLPNVAAGARLRLFCDKEGKEMWSVNAPEKEPRITSFRPSVRRDGVLRVSCGIDHSVKQPELWVRWSDDDGKSWHPVQTRLSLGARTKGVHTFDLSLRSVPAGKVLLQLVVNDGFFTTISKSRAIEVPKQPPAVSLLHPQQSEVIGAQRPMRLWAIVNDNIGRKLKTNKCFWFVDGKEVAQGTEAWMTAPTEGKHTCLLQVDIDGEKIEREVEFETIVVDAQAS